MALSPMMQQYMEIKENYKDCILFFRLGDFYEMFFDDAKTASAELELTLTGKNCGLEERAPMCGVPFHSADTYVARLVEKGYKVAICEQTEDPQTAKGIVKREVIRIVTPGTVTSENILKDSENNFLASAYIYKDNVGLSFCDISTGEINVTQMCGDAAYSNFLNEMVRIAPKELIINQGADIWFDIDEIQRNLDIYTGFIEDERYNKNSAISAVNRQFGVRSPEALGIGDDEFLIYALGMQLNYLFETQKQIIDVDQNTRQREYQKLDITSFDDHIRANIKIADGCDNFCSYCIIPYIRGKFRSRDEAEILCEAQNLLKNGYKELILTGIDSASYGEDNHASFNGLLRKLVKLPGLERLSISSIEASQIDDDFISIFKENPVIARHLHIPLQSGSETVLKRMNRKYDKEDFLAKMEKLYQADNDVFLACDVICGFPGETDEEFTETEDFIKKCHFSFLHVFPYSVREGTLAAKMKNQVPASIKKERVRKLLSLSNELYQKYQDKMNGKMMHFLFESYDQKKKLYHGLSEYFLPLDIKSDKNIINQILCLEYQK